jgi:hypothetical protein
MAWPANVIFAFAFGCGVGALIVMAVVLHATERKR